MVLAPHEALLEIRAEWKLYVETVVFGRPWREFDISLAEEFVFIVKPMLETILTRFQS
jgi:hypothetical protein